MTMDKNPSEGMVSLRQVVRLERLGHLFCQLCRGSLQPKPLYRCAGPAQQCDQIRQGKKL